MFQIRDMLRAKLDPLGTHQHWLVGDISYMQAPLYDGCGFGIYHMDGAEVDPVATGPAWVFLFPGYFASGLVDVGDFLQNAQIPNFAKNSHNASTTIATNGPPLIHYCETGGTTTPYGFGYDANGSLVGGDFSPCPVNVWTNFADFMPTGTFLYGVIHQSLTDKTAGNLWAMVWDHDLPAMAIYTTFALRRMPDNVVIMGEIIEPNVSTDTRKSGVARWDIAQPTNTAGMIVNYQSCWAYNEAGTRTEYTVTLHNSHLDKFPITGFESADRIDGVWQWDPILLINSTHFKGQIDPRVARESSTYTGEGLVIGNFFKATRDQMFMYDASFPAALRFEDDI